MTTLALIGLAAAAFATTNVDDLLLLLGFMADARFGFREVLAGQMLGIGILTALSLPCRIDGGRGPGRLGGPDGPGADRDRYQDALAAAAWTRRNPTLGPRSRPGGAHRRPAATVALVTLANGGDNIAAYTPIFATETGPERNRDDRRLSRP